LEKKIELDGRIAIVSGTTISLDGFNYSPAEVEKITGLLGLTGSMAGLRSLPPEISNPPFKVEFQESGVHKFTREDGSNIGFEFDEISEIIEVIEKTLAISLDLVKLQPKTYPVSDLTSGMPDIIEGR
jgi:hypothetical protein